MTTLAAKNSAKEEFLAWYANEKKGKGLVDIKFYPGDASDASETSVYSELNAINHAVEQGNFTTLTNI